MVESDEGLPEPDRWRFSERRGNRPGAEAPLEGEHASAHDTQLRRRLTRLTGSSVYWPASRARARLKAAHVAARAAGRWNVGLEHVVHHHAVGAESPPERANRSLHA